MALKLYNSLTKTTEEFKPLKEGFVGLYTCGPTVYAAPHIGNLRAYIFADTLKRALLNADYEVKHIMNLTDIDDKTVRDSQKVGENLKDFTEKFIQLFYTDIEKLNILKATKYTKATDYINEMIKMIEVLIEKDFAYKTEDGSVYFKISSDLDYGKLNNIEKDFLQNNASGRINTKDEYDKENIQDFALWKAWDENDGDVFWQSPFGGSHKGRPGWHIECSAMSIANLGNHFDIHTGGMDNKFPHHENEIAQSECATGEHFVNYWLHNGWLLVDDKKMSKSANNFYVLDDIVNKGFSPLSFRYLMLQTNYKSPVNFTWESIESSNTALNKLQRNISEFPNDGKINTEYKNQADVFINDDLSTPQVLALVWKILKDEDLSGADKKSTILEIDKLLGLDLENSSDKSQIEIPQDVIELAELRLVAKKESNYELSDKLRKDIENKGFLVKDLGDSYKIEKL